MGTFLGPEDINTAGTARAQRDCVGGATALAGVILDWAVLLTDWARFCTC